MSKYREIDLSRVKTIPFAQRKNKLSIPDLAKVSEASLSEFVNSLPHILIGRDFRELVDAIVRARQSNQPVIVMMGAHVIKVGLAPVLIDLIERGIITALAMNGAGAVHDVELAYFGGTSEEVAEGLADGTFGMVRETGELLNTTLIEGRQKQLGFGEALGERIARENPPYKAWSLLGRGYELNTPVTVHVAIGTDIVHQHPSADGAVIGELSFRDFRIFTYEVSRLGQGGVVLNLGSAVILPEVFLKALTVVRNLGYPAHHFVTANFDMYRLYRPQVNVVERPVLTGGKGYHFSGHHEIMIPLLAAAVKEQWAKS